MKKSIIFFLFLILILISYLTVSHYIGKYKFINLPVSPEIKLKIKEYFFPYKVISQQKQKLKKIEKLNQQNRGYVDGLLPLGIMKEVEFKDSLKNITTEKLKDTPIDNGLMLKRNKINEGFYVGIYNMFPGSGFIDFHNNNLFILSARGVLGFTNIEKKEKISFNQIDNNINEFIGLNQFLKKKDNNNYKVDGDKFSIKDMSIIDNRIFISYNDEIKEDCWNTSVIYSEVNYTRLVFKKLFSSKNNMDKPDECIHSSKNIDEEFAAVQAGGRIIKFDNDNILLSTGDYRNRYLAQDKKSINGKIIKINILNSKYEIISMGHRNPYGLYYDIDSNYVLATENGPQGGDEINLIYLNKDVIQNYGWPKVSAGEHYGGKNPYNNTKYEKYPLYKSHTKYGFIEPLKSFVPSIGISEIIKINEKEYIFASLRAKSLYFLKLNDANEIADIKKVEIFERIRDLKLKDNTLFMFLENSPSLGRIELN